ncbi:4538_t:CDS:10 [Ambispora leptoticha]|uniref:4538_t:CDS:1 n=1 Tax=Ambispora leptoticha TaxID=144679 RepID=A0A9N9AV68_9GLOM|nr:4538_t:CDS:10 [Ambispora leptoticha]
MDPNEVETETPSLDFIKSNLRDAILQCSDRGLYFAAKWAAETLNSLPESFIDTSTSVSDSLSIFNDAKNETTENFSSNCERDKYLLAKSYFDVKEFDRASFVLEKCVSPKSLFLKIYAKYLAGEKRKEEESNDIMGPLDDPKAINKELVTIQEELEKLYNENEMDGFLLYLYGLITKQLGSQRTAIKFFLSSVNAYSYNWSAWLELSQCVGDKNQLKEIMQELPKHFMTKFFDLHTSVELNENQNNFYSLLSGFSPHFKDNKSIKTLKAIVHYNNREFAEAEREFDELILSDPFRLDDMDIYSNVLYVMDKKAKLSFLAHMSANTDKYRSETMCIIGNYYSLKSEREKAISYFKRALQVNRHCLTAWTLMGHEYVELKNTHAAVVAYKRALEVNPNDYRAWFGLGQTYQFLKMDFYAIYYYERATVLRPQDARMWEALAGLYETVNVNSQEKAIKCYEHTLECSDCDDNSTKSAVSRLATLYESIDPVKAAKYHKMILQRDDLNADAEELRNAHRFLAHYNRDLGDIKAATTHAQDLMNYGGTAREEGRNLMNDLTSLAHDNPPPPPAQLSS